MAVDTGNDKSIGRLTLDISDVQAKIKEVNSFLSQIGANINLEDKLSKKIGDALRGLVNEAKKAGEEAAKAVEAGTAKASGNNDNLKNAIKLWREYYNVLAQAETALRSNDNNRFSELRSEAEEIRKRASALREEKEVWDQTAAARRRYETAYSSTISKTHIKEEAEYAKELAYNIREATEAKKAEEKANESAAREVQKEIEERDKLTQMYRQMFDEIDARNAKALDNARAQELKQEQTELDKLIKLYQEYFDYKTKGVNAGASGNTASQDMYNGLAHGVYEEIHALLELHPELQKTAEASDKVAASQANWLNAINSSAIKDVAASTKEYEKNITDYKDALVAMLNEQAKFNQQVASGKLVEGSEEYKAAEAKLKDLESEAVRAGQKLDQAGREAAIGMQQVKLAMDDVNRSSAAFNDAQQVAPLKQIEDAYKQLTTAIKDYNLAKKANNQEGMDYAQGQINNAMQVVGLIQQEINALNVDEDTRQRILSIIEQCKIQQDAQQKGVIGTSQATGELESQVKGLVTRYLSLMAVIRTISNIMNNMVEYVSEYSDKMNEIQMITMKTDDEVAKLADTYRNLAADMSVSSLDMADAAIYFTRQGLAAEEIERRLKNVTMYAKAANVEFKDASEIITAVVNSMNLVEEEAEDGRNAAQRVADVFLQIGDHAATSGQEIGEAMQKAAASAGAFGVSMEWLASYIATVSETTRQEARTIGTAFNTIIARLHQIKATGYNQEDETKVNDIAKALSKIDVVLMDQEGNWRDMEDILVDVAGKWGELDGKTRSYIATTMAGVKQQNVFLALMNDMSKGAENGSRAFELHAMAMESDGVAAEKYGVYLDSVTAAQERLTIAQENFYSLLDQSVIKDFYDSMANVVNYFTEATKAANGLNIIIPLLVGGIAALSAAVGMLESHPVILAITGVIAGITLLTTACGLLVDSVETVEERFTKATNVLSESKARVQSYVAEQQNLRDMMEDIGTETPITSDKLSEYNDLLEELGSISPTARQAIDDLKEGIINQADAARILNEELEKAIENEREISTLSFISKMATWQPGGTEDNGFAKSMTNWHDEWTEGAEGEEGFGNQLKHAYEHRKKHMSSILLDTKTFDYINSILPEGDDVDWGYIGQLVWREFVGTGDPNAMKTSLKNEVDKMIDEAVDIVGSEFNEVDKGIFREMLVKELFGEDNELSADEYKEAGEKISKLSYDVFKNGLSSMNIENEDSIKYIGERLFGNYFSLLFGDQFESFKNDPEFDVISSNIIAAISELFGAGFSDVDVASLLENIDLRNWGSAVAAMKQKLRDEIKNNAGVEGLGLSIIDLVTGEETYDPGMWLDLDTATLKYINDLILAGVQFNDIQLAMDTSGGSSDVLKEKLANLAAQLGITGDDAETAGKSLKDMIKDAKSGIKDIQAIDSAIESVQASIKDGSNINYGDIFGLIELHPEIMTVIGDSEKLLAMLKKIREEAGKSQHESFKSMLLNNGKTSGTKFEGSGFETLSEYRDSIKGDTEAIKEFDEEIDRLAGDLQLADENYKQMTKDEKEAAKEAKNLATEAAKVFKENLSEVETLDKTISKLQDSKKIDFSDIVNLSSSHPEIVAYANDANKLIEILQRLKEEAKGKTKDSIKDILFDSEEYFKETEYYNPDSNIKTMREYITSLHESRGDWKEVAMEVDEAAQNIVDAADESSTAAETWLEAQMKIAEINDEVNWAKSNHFEDQISQLQTAVDTGGIEAALELYNSWDDAMQQAVGTEYPNFVLMLTKASNKIKEQGKETANLTEETNGLSSALKTATDLNNIKYFKDSAKAIKQLSEGTISASDAYDVYTKDLNKVTKAYEDILDVQAKMEYNAKDVNKDNQQAIDAADVNNLATLLGLTTDEILADFPSAIDMFNKLTGEVGELQDVINMLNDTAFIRITGTSDADFSAIEAGLISVKNLADDAVQKLLATGQWTTEVIDLPQTAAVWHPGDPKKGGGYWSYDTVEAGATILKPTGNNLFKGASTVNKKADTKQKTGRSGGGGSSKDSSHDTKKTETEVERMLDLMSQMNTIQQSQQNYYQSQQKYYQQTGQLQGVIAYMQKEKEVLEDQNGTLDDNIKKIERYMEAKRAEISTMSTEDEKYEEVADDLDKLQKAHQNYTKQLIDNKTAIEALNEQMDEQRKKIRQMEIDLRNLVLSAIEDREKKRTDMLNAEIEMENKILDLITKRYEKERDDIIRTTELKINSLNEEKDLLDEQLRIRKEQAEAEDKQLKLRELEAKYQRIISDPTRKKEAQSLKKEIDDLRKEMAWDVAEEEVKSQQDSIDQQIESLEDYKEYIENYYEDLFEHPQKLIEEMRTIIMGTQEEIIQWLKENDEEYQNSSENTQAAMVTGWAETYNEMKGILQTYWEEVEEIIAQGDDYIIEFLKENSSDYAAAGKLQAEAYVDEWKKQLSDLKKAYEQVATSVASNYSVIQKATGNANGSSNSSGGSSSSGGKVDASDKLRYGYTTTDSRGYNKSEGGTVFASNTSEAQYLAKQDIKAKGWQDRVLGYVYRYLKGGLASYTGPAWVDGSSTDPERILSPYQTKLFESMIQVLENIDRIAIPSMQNYSNLQTSGGSGVSVGDIVVNVDNLDTDDDYEMMADKVCEILMERIGQTAAIGGLRIRSI